MEKEAVGLVSLRRVRGNDQGAIRGGIGRRRVVGKVPETTRGKIREAEKNVKRSYDELN